MHCPHDQSVLLMTERQGVEIDYCPTCRGVWLDRGELDKLLDGAAVHAGAPVAQPAYGTAVHDDRSQGYRRDDDGRDRDYRRRDDDRGDYGRRDDRHDDGRRRRRKRESWLEDLFDF